MVDWKNEVAENENTSEISSTVLEQDINLHSFTGFSEI